MSRGARSHLSLSFIFILAAGAAAAGCGSSGDGAGGAGGGAGQGGSAGGAAGMGGMGGMGGAGGGMGGMGGGMGGAGGGMGGMGGGGGAAMGCGTNTLMPGDKIHLKVSGSFTYEGDMNQMVGAGCANGKSADRTAQFNFLDTGFKALMSWNWNLDLDPAYMGKSNKDLVGKTLTFVGTPGMVGSVGAQLTDTVAKDGYAGLGGAITIDELDDTHVKGCVHSFTSWTTKDAKTVTIDQPIKFNCKH